MKCSVCYEVPKMLFSSPSSYLFHHHFDVLERHALVIVPNDELEEVVAEYFEHHANVRSVDAGYFEVVEQHH